MYLLANGGKLLYSSFTRARTPFQEVKQIIYNLSPCPMVALPRPKTISLLTCSKHHICLSQNTKPSDATLAWDPFPFLELDIVRRDDMGKQRLDFIGRKESSGADTGTGQVNDHKRQIEMRTMCAAQVQMPDVHWTWTPFDVCLL